MVVVQQQDDPLMTFSEAMGYLRVSRSTLYRLMWSGQLPGSKVQSRWRFRRSHLDALIEQQKMCALPPLAIAEQVV